MQPHPDVLDPQRLLQKTARMAALLTLAAVVSSGCTMNQTQQRTGTGAAIGALGGALLGTSREAAVVGAAVGAAGGFVYDQYQKRQDTAAQNAQLKAENAQLKQQQSSGQ